VLSAQAQDSLGRPQTGLQLSGRMLAGDGSSADIALREVGPGQYRAVVGGARPGAYLVQLVAQDAQGQPFGAVTAGAVVPQSAEYRSRGADPALLEALARSTGGRASLTPATAFDTNLSSQGAVREIGLPLLWLALLLLPFDIALRRLLFARDQVAATLRKVGLARLVKLERGTAEGVEGAEASREQRQQRPAKGSVAGDGALRAGNGDLQGQSDSSKPALQNPKSKIQNPKSKIQNGQPDLDRLREAQERARRRARGEE
jgi:hypothetical protein